MHEHGIAREIVDLALQYARSHHARQITQFSIAMSSSADESEDALRFYLEELTRGTIARGARFEITREPARLTCLECQHVFDQVEGADACPKCGSARVAPQVEGEFRLVSIEVE